MKEEIEKSIREFAKDNPDLAKILTIFASALVVVISKVIIEMNGELVTKTSSELLKDYDNSGGLNNK